MFEQALDDEFLGELGLLDDRLPDLPDALPDVDIC